MMHGMRHNTSRLIWCLSIAFACATTLRLGAAPDEARSPSTPNTTGAGPEGGSDWPAFLGPTGDSKSPETGILASWPEEGPPVVWQRQIGESYGIGSVSKGRFLQFDRYEDKARLTCMDARTGEDIWRFDYPTDYVDMYGYNGGPRCSPVIDDDRVYIFGVEGMLHCLRAHDGQPIWKVDTAKQFGVVQNFFGVGSTPVVEGRLLIVMVGGSPPESQNVPRGQLDRVVGNGSGVVAFDKMTGAVAYRITDELASYAPPKLATINGRRWCFVFARGGLVGFEPATGKVDFHYPWRAKKLESANASSPVVVADQVFISETYGPGSSLLRVRPGAYDVVWRDEPRSRKRAMQTHWNTPIYHDGYLYGSSGRHTYEAELRCIHWETGKIAWSIPDLTRMSLLYVDGHFICLGEYGHLLLVKTDPREFQLVTSTLLRDKDGERLLEYPCWAAPILSHGLLYVRGKDRLVCLELIPPGR
jgi:outer membrane protein assembly factor BamB